MASIQQNNLMNSQWPDLFAFSQTIQNTNQQNIILDTTENFYSTDLRVDYSNRVFSDRSEPKVNNQSNVAHFLFDQSTSKKRKSVKQGYLSSSIDQFRQGIDIRSHNHLVGVFKISGGTAGHLIDPNAYGINDSNRITDGDFFQEINLFNPIEFIDAQGQNKLVEQTITFPIVTSDSNQRENFILNGIIEPFPIRPVISQFSINFPFEPHGVFATFGNGNLFLRTSSDDVVSIYNIDEISNRFFYDSGEFITLVNDDASQSVDAGPSLPYISLDENLILPFKDEILSRGDEFQSSRSYESDLLDVIKRMPRQESTYLGSRQKSGKTGFIYSNSLHGVDSISYGDLLR